METRKGKKRFGPIAVIVFVPICLLSIALWGVVLEENSAMGQSGTTVTLAPSADTYIASGDPQQRRPALGAIWVGHDTDNLLERRSLLAFDEASSQVPVDHIVTSAKLQLKSAATIPSNDGPLEITAYRIQSDFPENINWQEYEALAVDRSQSGRASVGTALQVYEWDVTTLVQDWQTDRSVPLGLLLEGNQQSGKHRRAFWSKECESAGCEIADKPVLVITHQAAPDPTPNPTPEPTAIPEAKISLHVTTTTSEPEGTAIYPGSYIDINIAIQNSVTETSNVVISSRLTSSLELVNDGEAEVTTGLTETVLVWSLDSLSTNGSRSYRYRVNLPERVNGLQFDPSIPPEVDQNDEIAFIVSPVPSGRGYCYKWEMGDGTVHESLDLHTIRHYYSDLDSHTPKVTISRSPDYYAEITASVTVRSSNRARPESFEFRNDPCTAQLGRQNILIRTEVTWDQGGVGPVLNIVKPSDRLLAPLVNMPE